MNRTQRKQDFGACMNSKSLDPPSMPGQILPSFSSFFNNIHGREGCYQITDTFRLIWIIIPYISHSS